MSSSDSVSLTGKYGSFDLYKFEDKYYASNVEYDTETISKMIAQKKLISADSEKLLIDIIDNANKWADMRGMYSLEEKDQASAIRANSFNLDVDDDAELGDSELFFSNGEYYIIDKSEKNILDTYNMRAVASYSVSASPELITDYKGVNIIEFDKTYFGLDQSVGSIDFTAVAPNEVDGIMYGESVRTVMDLIDELVDTGKEYPVPQLIEEYEGHNIVGYKDKIYGVSLGMGDIDLTSVDEDKIIVATSIKEAKVSIEELVDTGKEYPVPQLIEEYEEHNIVGYEDKNGVIFRRAVRPVIGAIEKLKILTKITEPNIVDDVKPKQVLIEIFENFQIFEFEGMYFGIPVEMGSYDLSMEDYFAESKILYDTSIFGLKEAINVTT